jgi:hypothetical protein
MVLHFGIIIYSVNLKGAADTRISATEDNSKIMILRMTFLIPVKM